MSWPRSLCTNTLTLQWVVRTFLAPLLANHALRKVRPPQNETNEELPSINDRVSWYYRRCGNSLA